MKCQLTRPTITAAEIPAARIGYEAAALLERLMSGAKPPAGPIQVPATGVIAIRQSSAIANAADREVQQAAELIRSAAPGASSVSELAERMRVSPRWLQRHFKRVLGATPRERISNARLENAKRLLLETDWPASRIAAKAGYYSPSHLNRVMREQTGMTPLQFRKRHRL
jgi:LacI family transcriptional regulator